MTMQRRGERESRLANVIERRISDRAFVKHYLLAAVAGIAIAVVGFMTPLAVIIVPLAVLPAAIVFLYTRLARAGSSYRLFPDRIEIESGIFSRKIENVELFRVRDVGLRQGFFGRLSDFGDIYIHSTDSSTPDLHVSSIDAPKEFYQDLRERIAASRGAGRTVIMEESHPYPEP
jgi:uncharacterized membrane protein YdbT with pleckstrin-like domain